MSTSKTKITVAVACALGIAAHAQADELTIYGTVGAALELIDNGDTSTTEVNNNHSAFGLKGSKDIQDGLKGVYLFDAFVGIDAGGGAGDDSLFGGGRDGWVGLSGESWGIVALGFQGRPWKTSTNHLDIFGSTAADYSAILGTTGDSNLDGKPEDAYFDGGIGNSLIYFGPNINGFSWHLQFGADEQDDSTNDWGAQVNYSNDSLYLSLSHDVDGQGDDDNVDDISATKLAASFTFGGATTITGIFDQISGEDATSRDAFYIALAHRIANTTLKLAYGVADDNDDVSDSGATYVTLGVSHKLTDDIELYALYSQLDNDENGTYTYISEPHTTSSGNTGIPEAGEDSNVIAAGIRYDFAWEN